MEAKFKTLLMGNREPLKGLKQWQDTSVLESSGWREEEWASLPKQAREDEGFNSEGDSVAGEAGG